MRPNSFYYDTSYRATCNIATVRLYVCLRVEKQLASHEPMCDAIIVLRSSIHKSLKANCRISVLETVRSLSTSWSTLPKLLTTRMNTRLFGEYLMIWIFKYHYEYSNILFNKIHNINAQNHFRCLLLHRWLRVATGLWSHTSANLLTAWGC